MFVRCLVDRVNGV